MTSEQKQKLLKAKVAVALQNERDLIRERTQAGLRAARARGRVGGRPKAIADPKKLAMWSCPGSVDT